MKEVGEGGVAEIKAPKKRQTLLQRFGIPIEQVDFKYVETCKDEKKLERILRILQSGEEGFYPDLEKVVKDKLAQVDPMNRFLRHQVPILRPESLESHQRAELESDLSEWLKSTANEVNSVPTPTTIFESDDPPVPIRGSTFITKSDTAKSLPGCAGGGGDTSGDIPFLKPSNPNRIKSWEYDKWNKFNADAELMKLDIQDMKAEEADRVKAFKASNQAKGQEKAEDPPMDSPRPCCSKSIGRDFAKLQTKPSSPQVGPSSATLGHSFIEEIPNDPVVEKKSAPKRRVKITIDDINIGGF